MKKDLRQLPPAEQEVMSALWACKAPAARSDIEQVLYKSHPMAVTTLLTLLSRLADRQFISIEKDGRRSLYTPLVSQRDYLAFQSRNFFEKLCGGNISVFASALCDSGLSARELAQLRERLDKGEL